MLSSECRRFFAAHWHMAGLQVQSFDYNEPQAEKYIWMHQLTMMKEDPALKVQRQNGRTG